MQYFWIFWIFEYFSWQFNTIAQNFVSWPADYIEAGLYQILCLRNIVQICLLADKVNLTVIAHLHNNCIQQEKHISVYTLFNMHIVVRMHHAYLGFPLVSLFQKLLEADIDESCRSLTDEEWCIFKQFFLTSTTL